MKTIELNQCTGRGSLRKTGPPRFLRLNTGPKTARVYAKPELSQAILKPCENIQAVRPVFGGIDHPRFSIRGSGLQRGTQPAGRGIELRLDGLPITSADTSFDFVEFLEPLFFGEVGILRGGRGALEGGSTLGGIMAH